MTPAEARRALRALAVGVPPRDDRGIWPMIGQAEIAAELDADLAAVALGDFRGRLVLGNPGAGKSQLLLALGERAAARGFATSYVAHDPPSKVGFNRPDRIYRRIIEMLRLPARGGNDLDAPRVTGQPGAPRRGVDEPDAPPHGVDEPDALPRGIDQPDALLHGVDEPDALPHGVDEPDELPRGVDERDALPHGTDEPDALPHGASERDALGCLMDGWVDRSLPRLVGIRRSGALLYRLSAVGLLPRESAAIPARTRLALIGLLMATEQRDDAARAECLNVLRGVGLRNTELVQIVRQLGYEPGHVGWTPSPWDDLYHFGQLRTLLFVIRALGHAGLLVLFDETIAIVELGAPSRTKAYQVLDALLFNEYQCQGLHAVFAYIPALFNQLRADRDRLGAERAERWHELWRANTREIARLTPGQLRELLDRLAEIHGIARDWPARDQIAVDGPRLIALMDVEGLTTRDVIRHGVALLERRYAERAASAMT